MSYAGNNPGSIEDETLKYESNSPMLTSYTYAGTRLDVGSWHDTVCGDSNFLVAFGSDGKLGQRAVSLSPSQVPESPGHTSSADVDSLYNLDVDGDSKEEFCKDTPFDSNVLDILSVKVQTDEVNCADSDNSPGSIEDESINVSQQLA